MSQADWFARRLGHLQALLPGFQAAYGSNSWKILNGLADGDDDVDALVQQGILQASLATATGPALAGWGATVGVYATPAVAATCPIVFSLSPVNASASTVIPAGAVVMTNTASGQAAVAFTTQTDATIPANSGNSNVVTATCTTAGTVGNVPANSVVVPYSGVPAGVTVSNPAAGGSAGYTAGAAQESDDSLRASIYDALQNQTVAARVEGVALQTSGSWGSVFAALVVDGNAGTPDQHGNYTLYVCDSAGNSSTSLQNAVQANVLAMGNIGLTLTVAAFTLVTQAVAGTYTLLPGGVSATVNAGIVANIQAWMATLQPGAAMLPTDLILACYGQKQGIAAVPGLKDITITTPSAPLAATSTQIIRLSGTPSFSLGTI